MKAAEYIDKVKADRAQLRIENAELVEALEAIPTGEGHGKNGKKRYYSSYDSLRDVAREALARHGVKLARIPCVCDDGTDWSSGKAEICDLCGGGGEIVKHQSGENVPTGE